MELFSRAFYVLERLDPVVGEEPDLVVPVGDGPRPVGVGAALRLLVREQVLAHAEATCRAATTTL